MFRLFHSARRAAALSSLIAAISLGSLPLAVGSVHEVVAPFVTAPSSPLWGRLVPGPAGYLWGTTYGGGAYYGGTIYKVKPDGSEWETVFSLGDYSQSETGRLPFAGLVLHEGIFWGTTKEGGIQGNGTVFKFDPVTGIYTTVVKFTNDGNRNKGRYPWAGLTPAGDGFLWGTTNEGGSSNNGTVFKINPGSGSLTTVVQFTENGATNKGAHPIAGLLDGPGGALWGTTTEGGANGSGTVFKIKPSNGVLTTVVQFTGNSGAAPGSQPQSGLVEDGRGNLWGTTYWGGTSSLGTVYKINARSGALTAVLSFAGAGATNRGAHPRTTLTPDGDGFMWGTTADTSGSGSTSSDNGTVFKINIASGVLTSLATFNKSAGHPLGSNPVGELYRDEAGFMWGTTSSGGLSNDGTVYRIERASGDLETLIDFTVGDVEPGAGLVADSKGLLWGVSRQGGALGFGSIFKVDPVSGKVTTVLEFSDDGALNQGRVPNIGLVADAKGFLWGTTYRGGREDDGTIFKINPETGVLTTVRNVQGFDPANPSSPLLDDGNGFFWGTTNPYGGNGIIYKVNAVSGEITRVVQFTRKEGDYKGAFPYGGLVPDGTGWFWGTTERGGEEDSGTVYKINPVTEEFETLVEFTGRFGAHVGNRPEGGLALASEFMWGTTSAGGANGYGTVFKVRISSGIHTKVLEFSDNGSTNKGREPKGGLLYDSGFVWGTTDSGGSAGAGTLFKVETRRGGLSTEVSFTGNGAAADSGRRPSDGFLMKHSDGHIYGSTTDGGVGGEGTVYRLRFGPTASTLSATEVAAVEATLHGTVNANGRTSSVSFEYGTSPTLEGATVITIGSATGSTPRSFNRAVTGLSPSTPYYFRMAAKNGENPMVQYGEILEFTTLSNNADLASLSADSGTFFPEFAPANELYRMSFPFGTNSVRLTPVTADENATVLIDGTPVSSGGSSSTIPIPVGTTTIETLVTAQDTSFTKNYEVRVTRLPESIVYQDGSEIPISAEGFVAEGNAIDFELAYPPSAGTGLMVVRNTGLEFIQGRFSNLEHGQSVVLTFDGIDYRFVANYFGGTGNDLLLHWADTEAYVWGSNDYGQLGAGIDSREPWLVPGKVGDVPMFEGQTLLSASTGYLHSLCLTADGMISAWGYNAYGQLGDGSAETRSAPVPVDVSGALAGKTVVAISAGAFHSLALCSDGSVVSWGFNNHGQLGDGSTGSSVVPVAVLADGALAGRSVVGIAAGAYHSLALCSDGAVLAWGFNGTGTLGDGTSSNSPFPVVVREASGDLSAVAICAGRYHNLALRADGSVVAWGDNDLGQLGVGAGESTNVALPVDASGVLAGKKVTAICAGDYHSLALSSDHSIAAWGLGTSGQLGVGTIDSKPVPVGVLWGEALAGKSVVALGAGAGFSLALCSDGTPLAWGKNSQGQLGNGGTASAMSPVFVETSALGVGDRFVFVGSGSSASHSIGIVGTAAPVAVSARLLRSEFSAQTGGAGVLSDSDQDGIPDIMEYAFGLDPMANSAGKLPVGRIVDGKYVLSFTQPAGVSGIVYGAEWSATLKPGSWTDIPDAGTGNEHRFEMRMDEQKRMFVRLKVLPLE